MNKIYDWQDLGLQSLDIVLGAGKGKWSRRIRRFQRIMGASPEMARITHVAGIAGKTRTSVQEATTLNAWKDKRGVQSANIESWLRYYNGEVYVRKLYFERTDEYYRNDWGYWEVHKDDDYENGILGGAELLLAGLRLHRYVRWVFPNYVPPATPQPHCGEHQANRMKEHRVWLDPKIVVANRMPPYIWWGDELEGLLKVPISEPILIKG